MSISSSALASLVIAGTAIGGSTFAVMANTSSSDINSSNVSQITETGPSAKLPGGTIAPVDENGNPVTITPVSPTQTPAPTQNPISPTPPPPSFGGGDDDEDDEDSNEDSDDESYGDEDEEEDYGHDGYHGDDEDEEDEDED